MKYIIFCSLLFSCIAHTKDPDDHQTLQEPSHTTNNTILHLQWIAQQPQEYRAWLFREFCIQNAQKPTNPPQTTESE